MPLYQYSALDSSGKKRSGFIEAMDENEAKGKLREQGLMISSLETKTAISSKQNLSADVLLTITMQLSQLVNAGVPLYQSLSALEEQYRGESFHRILLGLCDQIKAGVSLSDALASYPQSFDRLYCSMVAAGESAGALDVVLEKLSILLAKQSKIKKQLVTSMVYPSVLAVFCLLVIGLLMGFVVPSMESIFSGKELNGFTEAVIGLSHFVSTYWWAYIPLIVLACFTIYWKITSPKGKLWVQKTSLKIPGIKTLVIQTAVARFCRTMSTLQIGGLPMIDSLRLSKAMMGNNILEAEIQEAENKIIEGSSLSKELMNSKFFPKMVSRMLAVGEDSGSTVAMLNKIADVYEDNTEKTLDRLMALVLPVILLFMGGVIFMVFLAILLPMTDISI